MFKKLIGILAVLIIALMSVGLFVACGDEAEGEATGVTTPAEDPQTEEEPEVHESEDGFLDF